MVPNIILASLINGNSSPECQIWYRRIRALNDSNESLAKPLTADVDKINKDSNSRTSKKRKLDINQDEKKVASFKRVRMVCKKTSDVFPVWVEDHWSRLMEFTDRVKVSALDDESLGEEKFMRDLTSKRRAIKINRISIISIYIYG